LFYFQACGNENEGKNTEVDPPSGFNGVWSVYDLASGKKIIEANYKNGKKNGRETRWWIRYHNGKMSEHDFRDGILHGRAVKWLGSVKVTEGIYRNGQPWEGSFAAKNMKEVDTSLEVEDQDSLHYFTMTFREGIMIKRGTVEVIGN